MPSEKPTRRGRLVRGLLAVLLVAGAAAGALALIDSGDDGEPTVGFVETADITADYCFRNSSNSWHKNTNLIECWWGAYIGPNSNGSDYKEAESTQIDFAGLIEAVNQKWPDAQVGNDTTVWLDAWGGSGGGINGGTADPWTLYLGGRGGMAQTITTPGNLGASTLYWYQGDKGRFDNNTGTASTGAGGGGAASLLTTKPISSAFGSAGGAANKVTTSNLSDYGVLLVAGGGGGGGGCCPCNNSSAHGGGQGGTAIATTAGSVSGGGAIGHPGNDNAGGGGGPNGKGGGGYHDGNPGFGGWGGPAHTVGSALWTDVDAVDPGAESWTPAGYGRDSPSSKSSGGGAGGGGYGGGGSGNSCFDGIGTSTRAAAGGGGGGSYAAGSTATDGQAPTKWVYSPSGLPNDDLVQMNQFPTDAALIITFSLDPTT